MARLRLIRALLGLGGLSVAAAHQVIQAIEEPPESVHELLGGCRQSRWLDRIWRTHSGRSMRPGFTLPEGALDLYQDHMRQIAEFEIDNTPTESPSAAVRYVVLGTVLLEPVILALRRAAEEEASARRFADRGRSCAFDRPGSNGTTFCTAWETGPRGDLRELHRGSSQGLSCTSTTSARCPNASLPNWPAGIRAPSRAIRTELAEVLRLRRLARTSSGTISPWST